MLIRRRRCDCCGKVLMSSGEVTEKACVFEIFVCGNDGCANSGKEMARIRITDFAETIMRGFTIAQTA